MNKEKIYGYQVRIYLLSMAPPRMIKLFPVM